MWTITGTVAQVNTALANLVFLPVASNTLDSAISVNIDDGDEDLGGPLLGAMTITVNPAPVVITQVVDPPPVDPVPPVDDPVDDPVVDDPVVDPPVDDPVVDDPVVDDPVVDPPVDDPPVDDPEAATPAEDPPPDSGDRVFINHGEARLAGAFSVDSVVDAEDRSAAASNNTPLREIAAAKPEGVDTLLLQLRDQLEYFNDPLQLIGAESFRGKLNDMREALLSETEGTARVIGNSLTLSAGLSVGYVIWLARSGVLLSSVLSSMPAWRFIDPLPVLSGMRGGADEDDDESLESMVENSDASDENTESRESR